MFTPRLHYGFAAFFPRNFISLVAAILVISSCAATPVHAQLTVETLIGDAVSNAEAGYRNVDEAIKRFTNRDFLAARQFLERANEEAPRLPPVDLTLAKMYLLSGQAAAGRASLERCVRDNPGDPEAYLILADELYRQGRLIEAGALYDKAILLIGPFTGNDKRKRNFEIRARAGRAAVEGVREHWEDAIVDLRAWVEADPDSANAHHRLGRALFLSKKAQEGFNELSKARELDASLPSPYVTAAVLYEQLGERNHARQTFKRAVDADKNDERTLLAYSQFLIQAGDIAEAENSLAVLRRANPDSLEGLILSGVVAKMQDKKKPAEDYLLTALAQSPANRSVINQLALLFIEQIDDVQRKRALEFARMNAQLYPDDPEANITLSWVMYQLQQTNEANQALQKGLRGGNISPDSKYIVAKMLLAQQRTDDAKRLLHEALDAKSSIFVERNEAQTLYDSL